MHTLSETSGSNIHMQGGDHADVLGAALTRRREGLGLTIPNLARKARLSERAVRYAERDNRAGHTVRTKLAKTLERLEAGETIEDQARIISVELRPGIKITVDADDLATLGDLRAIEDDVQRLIDKYAQ